MIIRDNSIELGEILIENSLEIEGMRNLFKKSLFFDLEHYVYKKPICIGVFGCCYYDEDNSALKVTQYMIESKKEIKSILIMARNYFENMVSNMEKKYIVTFSGNNDFHVIKYLFNKYKIDFNFDEFFTEIDLQKVYEKEIKDNIGLKALEKKFGIVREGELISGSNLAKTFSKIVKDRDYINRMPSEKIEKILLYNEQDVVNLFHIYTNWNTLKMEEDESEEKDEILEDNSYEKSEQDEELHHDNEGENLKGEEPVEEIKNIRDVSSLKKLKNIKESNKKLKYKYIEEKAAQD